MNTGILYSKKFLEHDLGPGHPERPERLRSIIESYEKATHLHEKTKIIDPSPASVEEIELAHEPSYVKKIEKLSKSEQMVDLDTPVKRNTYNLALLAAGGTIKISQKVFDKELDNGFALVRPPGHHATRNKGGGFCYFNNIAIATRKLLKENRAERVLIFDFDAHHGNGTQDIFYSDRSVLYISMHQDGRSLYPGTGFPEEIGNGDGEGFNVNIPFPPGSSDENYIAALRRFLIPLSEQFKPNFIMVSAGLDPHKADPLTGLQLSTKGFEWITKTAVGQADELCDGKIVFVLEGGYATKISAECALRIIEGLTNSEPPKLPMGKSSSAFNEVRKCLTPYWNL